MQEQPFGRVQVEACHARTMWREESALVRAAIEEAKAGGRDAIHFLYVRYAPEVDRLVGSLGGPDHEAADLAEAVFLELTAAIERYEPREMQFSTWLLELASGVACDLRTADARAVEIAPAQLMDGDPTAPTA